MKTKIFTLLFAVAASVGTMHAAIVDGTCGENLTWSLNTKDSTLTIEGSGKMTSHPWSDYQSYIKYVFLQDGLTSIGSYAFYYCSGLTSVTIPNSVTSIGDRAFEGCSGLTSVTIGNGVTSIGDNAFAYCSRLTSIEIPNSVNSIGFRAFLQCRGLISVTIGNGVTEIEQGAFEDCTGLTSVHIYDIAAWCAINFIADYRANPLWYAKHLYLNEIEITDLVIPNSVTSIGALAFSGCTGLTSVEIPNSVTSIGNSAFSGCTGLTSVTIPNSVASIGGAAFCNCSGLMSVTIGNSVTSIGVNAFWGCPDLTSITNHATTPQSINSDVFKNVNKSTCKLYVPAQSIEAYQNAIVWEDFTNILAIEDEPELELVEGEYSVQYLDKSSTELHQEVVTLHVPVAPTIEGFTFIGWQASGMLASDGIILQAVYEADEPTSAPATYTNPENPAQKLIRNGNVYILTEDKTYTLTGQSVK